MKEVFLQYSYAWLILSRDLGYLLIACYIPHTNEGVLCSDFFCRILDAGLFEPTESSSYWRRVFSPLLFFFFPSYR
jgi:hypothetical protein